MCSKYIFKCPSWMTCFLHELLHNVCSKSPFVQSYLASQISHYNCFFISWIVTKCFFQIDLIPKGQSLRSTRPVIGACCKISNNKICCNFGYVHEIAFCTAVPNLSQIGQPWFFTFSWGPPFANLWIFWYCYFMSDSLKIQRGDPMKKWKIKVVWFDSNFAQL